MTDHNRDFCREFITFIQVEKGLARLTLESYARDLARLNTFALKNGKAVSELTRADLRKWIASLSRDGLAPTSVARAVSAARGFYKFLLLDGHIKNHPAEDLDTPQGFSYLPKFLTEDEINRLFSAPDISTEEGIRDRAIQFSGYCPVPADPLLITIGGSCLPSLSTEARRLRTSASRPGTAWGAGQGSEKAVWKMPATDSKLCDRSKTITPWVDPHAACSAAFRPSGLSRNISSEMPA